MHDPITVSHRAPGSSSAHAFPTCELRAGGEPGEAKVDSGRERERPGKLWSLLLLQHRKRVDQSHGSSGGTTEHFWGGVAMGRGRGLASDPESQHIYGILE